MRCATVLSAEPLEGVRKPAIKLTLDFGPLGVKQSSAQITALYAPETLIGKQVIAVVNFPPKQIGKFMSECLVLGVVNTETSHVTLLTPERPVGNGNRIA